MISGSNPGAGGHTVNPGVLDGAGASNVSHAGADGGAGVGGVVRGGAGGGTGHELGSDPSLESQARSAEHDATNQVGEGQGHFGGGSVDAASNRNLGPEGVAVQNGGASGIAENHLGVSSQSDVSGEASASARDHGLSDRGTQLGSSEVGGARAQVDVAGNASDRAHVVYDDPSAAAASSASSHAESSVRAHSPVDTAAVDSAESRADFARHSAADPSAAVQNQGSMAVEAKENEEVGQVGVQVSATTDPTKK